MTSFAPLDEAPLVPEGEDDLFLLAVLGQRDRGRERIVTKVSELRQGGNEEVHALALVLEGMASGSTDDLEMARLAERPEPDEAWAGDFDSCWPWHLFARPDERARRLLLRARKRWNKDRRALASDGDGDFAEYIHREGAAVIQGSVGLPPPPWLAGRFISSIRRDSTGGAPPLDAREAPCKARTHEPAADGQRRHRRR